MTEPIDALQAETTHAQAFLAALSPDDWQRPTRCPPMTVRELAVHTIRGAYRIVEFLEAPPSENEPEKDAVSYFRYDPAVVGPGVVARAQEESNERPADADLASEWRAAWRKAIDAARAGIEANPVVVSPLGSIRFSEYLRTRCVEVTIHAMDLRDGVGLAPDPTPEGLEAACDVLRDLLGTDPRKLGIDEIRFALAGSGRAELTGEDRERLGPLADLFPLLQ